MFYWRFSLHRLRILDHWFLFNKEGGHQFERSFWPDWDGFAPFLILKLQDLFIWLWLQAFGDIFFLDGCRLFISSQIPGPPLGICALFVIFVGVVQKFLTFVPRCLRIQSLVHRIPLDVKNLLRRRLLHCFWPTIDLGSGSLRWADVRGDSPSRGHLVSECLQFLGIRRAVSSRTAQDPGWVKSARISSRGCFKFDDFLF